MRKQFLCICLLCASVLMAETTPIFYESFNKCVNDDYYKGYTGGNDGQWGGDIAKELVIYFDNNSSSNAWDYTNCNGANQCVKVGLNKQNGSITTPEITCSGDVTLTFRAAPWVSTYEDSVINVLVSSGTIDQSSFEIHTNKWNDINVKIFDVENSVKITFQSANKNRFFLDEVKVFPADPTDAVLRVSPKGNVSFGTLGTGYSQQSKELTIEAQNITPAGVAVSFEDTQNAFVLDKSKLTPTGGKLTVSCKTGLSQGEYSATLKLSATSAKNASEKLVKTIFVGFQVAASALQGGGTKENPYTVSDVLTLWENGTLWGGEKVWVRGYILGGVARNSSDQYAGVSQTEYNSLVLSADPANTNKILTVQLENGAARAALNVVDNPELVGKEVFVYGTMNMYLGVYGVRGVKNEDQYVRDNLPTGVETIATQSLDLSQPMFDILGRRVDGTYHGIVIQNGQKWLK